MSHHNLLHKFVQMHQVMKVLDAKAAVDKEWKRSETISQHGLEKVNSKTEDILEAQRDKKGPLCNTDGHVSP